jgi:hypothetical protein
MVNLKKFNSPKAFWEYNEGTLNTQYFEHFHLHNLLDDVRNGQEKLHDAYNVLDDDGSNVLIVWVDELIFLYGTVWNDDVLDVIVEQLHQIDISTVHLFRGQRDIVVAILNKVKCQYEIINHRLIYNCDVVKPLSKKPKGKFGIANFADAATILKMSVDYYVEEFEGKGQQSHDSVKQSAYQGIRNSAIYKWSNNGRIVSKARAFGNDPLHPMIGGLFTKPTERNKGYAYLLLSYLSTYLLEHGAKKCGLLTEATKITTSKIFERVGYTKVYEWINIHKI